MNLTIERAALLRALGHVQSVVERRTTQPILSNALLRATPGELALVATDMDVEMVETVAADVIRPGSITAPAHTLHDIVRKLPDGAMVELDCPGDGTMLSLASGRSRFRLGCLPADDFPRLSGGDFPHSFELAASDLRVLIDRTRFAISTEETRYYLNGIFLHAARSLDGGAEQYDVPVLRAVATDGHRLARVEVPLPEGAAGIPGVIIPRKAVGEVRRLIEEAAGRVELALSESRIRFSFDSVVLTSKLIDGTFPDYARVIPPGNDKVLEVASRPFLSAVDRVATISTEKSRAVKLTVGANQVTVSATSPEAGSASEEMEAQYANMPLEIGFNARYLMDIAGQIEGDVMRIILADSAAPAIIRDAATPAALYVLMPMRV